MKTEKQEHGFARVSGAFRGKPEQGAWLPGFLAADRRAHVEGRLSSVKDKATVTRTKLRHFVAQPKYWLEPKSQKHPALRNLRWALSGRICVFAITNSGHGRCLFHPLTMKPSDFQTHCTRQQRWDRPPYQVNAAYPAHTCVPLRCRHATADTPQVSSRFQRKGDARN